MSSPPADLEKAREQFPTLEGMCYLNTASIGLMPLDAQAAAEKFQRQLAGYGTTGFDEATEVGVLDSAREAAASLLSAPAEQIAVTTSVTEALSQIAWSLKPAEGTNVVSIDLEFPSVTYPWMRVAQESGAEVRLVKAAHDPASLSIGSLEELVDDDTEVICVSQVQYATGHLFTLDELADLAQSHGAWLIVDATQSLGALPIDLAAARVDALVCAGYKWLCGPFGAAVCFLGDRLLERLDPVFVGWKSTADPYSMDAANFELGSPLERMEYSTMAYEAGVSLAEAIRFVDGIGAETILAHNRGLAAELRDGLQRLGAEVISPDDEKRRTGIVTAQFPGRDGEEVAAWLNQSGVIVSPRFGSTRFSVHLFNTADEVSHALEVLEAVLERGGAVPSEGQAPSLAP